MQLTSPNPRFDSTLYPFRTENEMERTRAEDASSASNSIEMETHIIERRLLRRQLVGGDRRKESNRSPEDVLVSYADCVWILRAYYSRKCPPERVPELMTLIIKFIHDEHAVDNEEHVHVGDVVNGLPALHVKIENMLKESGKRSTSRHASTDAASLRERDDALQRARDAEETIRRLRDEKDKALKRAQVAEATIRRLRDERDDARRVAKEAERTSATLRMVVLTLKEELQVEHDAVTRASEDLLRLGDVARREAERETLESLRHDDDVVWQGYVVIDDGSTEKAFALIKSNFFIYHHEEDESGGYEVFDLVDASISAQDGTHVVIRSNDEDDPLLRVTFANVVEARHWIDAAETIDGVDALPEVTNN